MASTYDDLINGTFNSLGSNATSGWVSPSYQSGMLGRGLPASMGQDRLPQGSAGLPNPSPGSGLTQQQLTAMGGWAVDPQTGQLAYSNGSANPAVTAATGQAAPWSPTALPGMVQGATPVPRAAAGSPTSSGQGGLIDMLGGLFGATNAGSLLKSLSPDTFYGIGEALKGGATGASGSGGFSDSGLKGLLNGRPAGSTETTTSWGANKVGPGGESWAAGPRPSGSSGGGDSLVSDGGKSVSGAEHLQSILARGYTPTGVGTNIDPSQVPSRRGSPNYRGS